LSGYREDEPKAFIRVLSPAARRRILEILLERRSYRELALQLGVSPAAIAKYLSGRAAPRDDVMARALSALEPEEAEDVALIVTEEMAEAVESFIDWLIGVRAPAGPTASMLERAATRLRLEGNRGRVRIL